MSSIVAEEEGGDEQGATIDNTLSIEYCACVGWLLDVVHGTLSYFNDTHKCSIIVGS